MIDVQWFVGIDWATQSHCVCLLDVEGRLVNERDFAHDGASDPGEGDSPRVRAWRKPLTLTLSP